MRLFKSKLTGAMITLAVAVTDLAVVVIRPPTWEIAVMS